MRKFSFVKSNRRLLGFTVVELMVAVAILGIVVAAAVPNFTSLIQRNRLVGTANSMLSALNLARSEAIKQNTSTLFCHSSDGQTCSSAPDTGWEGYIIRTVNDATPILSHLLSGPVEIQGNDAISNSSFADETDVIRFSGFGLARAGASNTALNGVFIFCGNADDGDNELNLRVQSGGRMQVLTPAQQNNCNDEDTE